MDDDTHHSGDEIPKLTRRLPPARRLRKRAMAVEDRETGEFISTIFFSRFFLNVFSISVKSDQFESNFALSLVI